MKTKNIFIVFIMITIVQLAIPSRMIFNKEDILLTGKIYKFTTQPIDPNDPFKGKYITLRYKLNNAGTTDTLWQRNDKIYVYLREDSLGFAALDKVSREKLNITQDYVIGSVTWNNRKKREVGFNLPFNRFYMNENKAEPAEKAYIEAQQDSFPNNTYGLVVIKNGNAVLKDVIINEVPMAEYVQKIIESQ